MESFLAMLAKHGIQTLVDVRSSPYSRHAPQFSKRDLAEALNQAGIRYVYEGQSLGGRPADPKCYRKGVLPPQDAEYLDEVDYAAVMKSPWFLEGVERLLTLAAEAPTAILCSEANPAECHRHHLIATYIVRKHPSVDVIHIVEKGAFSARNLPSKADDPTVIQPSLF
jgi:uncharacterized protein (DUF488 family)